MRQTLWISLLAGLACPKLGAAKPAPSKPPQTNGWIQSFPMQTGELLSSGRNPYFILEPGYQQVLAGDGDQVTITVLNKTKLVDGVHTRVVEERETKDGKLVEVSRNYYAISKRTHDVYYFGEDVDMYKDGKITNHGGAWLAGTHGAKFGLMMSAKPALRMKAYQELAPGAAMDRAEIVSLHESVKTPAGTFKNCIKTEETSPVEPGSKEYKQYAPGVGIVQDDETKLVTYGMVKLSK